MPERVRMALLTSVSGSFAAHVLVARLQAEGIEAELRGAVDGPYPFSVGGLAEVEVYVPEDDLPDARMVLLADEVDAAVEGSTQEPKRWRASDLVIATLVVLALVALAVARATQVG